METEVLRLSLLFARVGAFLFQVPILGGSYVPRMVKMGLAVALTLVWYVPGEAAELDMSQLGIIWSVAREVVLGAVFGFIFVLLLSPVKAAGEVLAQEIGLTFGNLATASGQNESNAITAFLDIFALTLFVLLDGHQAILQTLHTSLKQYPPGETWAFPMIRITQGMKYCDEWGLVLAGPVAFGLFLTTVTLLMMTRAAPQMNLYTVAFPVRALVGLGLLMWMLPEMGKSILAYLSTIMEHWNRIV